jgi:hypothetical protein
MSSLTNIVKRFSEEKIKLYILSTIRESWSGLTLENSNLAYATANRISNNASSPFSSASMTDSQWQKVKPILMQHIKTIILKMKKDKKYASYTFKERYPILYAEGKRSLKD